MKTTRFPWLPVLLLLVSLPVAGSAASETAAYEQAVKSYITAATSEVQAIRQAVDATCKDATPEVKARYAGVYAKLEICEKLLAELRTAPAKDFDRIKAQYEQQRVEMGKARDAAEKR
jgi:hypothetical protein